MMRANKKPTLPTLEHTILKHEKKNKFCFIEMDFKTGKTGFLATDQTHQQPSFSVKLKSNFVLEILRYASQMP